MRSDLQIVEFLQPKAVESSRAETTDSTQSVAAATRGTTALRSRLPTWCLRTTGIVARRDARRPGCCIALCSCARALSATTASRSQQPPSPHDCNGGGAAARVGWLAAALLIAGIGSRMVFAFAVSHGLCSDLASFSIAQSYLRRRLGHRAGAEGDLRSQHQDRDRAASRPPGDERPGAKHGRDPGRRLTSQRRPRRHRPATSGPVVSLGQPSALRAAPGLIVGRRSEMHSPSAGGTGARPRSEVSGRGFRWDLPSRSAARVSAG